MIQLRVNISNIKHMDSVEFLDVRGKKLVAQTTWVGTQEFVMAAVLSDRVDSATADI